MVLQQCVADVKASVTLEEGAAMCIDTIFIVFITNHISLAQGVSAPPPSASCYTVCS